MSPRQQEQKFFLVETVEAVDERLVSLDEKLTPPDRTVNGRVRDLMFQDWFEEFGYIAALHLEGLEKDG